MVRYVFFNRPWWRNAQAQARRTRNLARDNAFVIRIKEKKIMTMINENVNVHKELEKEDFEVSSFLKLALSSGKKGADGREDIRKLRDFRSSIQTMAEESSQAIKKNVFQNYTQFIDTAKEISYLESEMYQLNHLLTEQKNLIEQMMDTSFSGTDKEKTSGSLGRKLATGDEKRSSMQGLLEKVEGTSHLADNPNRHIIFESDLSELDAENGSFSRSVHCFLLNDGFMLTCWIPHRLGPMRYRFESLFPLDSLAVVNVKDSVTASNAFKLLVFPEHKLFSCENSRLKRKWMDSFDSAKKQMLQEGSLVRQATIRSKKRASISSPDTEPFPDFEASKKAGSETSLAEVEWLKELPDELDVCIAQRDFDTAIELLFEGRENLTECSDTAVVQDVREKLVQKERNLVEVLSRELKVTSEKSLQGGPKATRKAITLLNKLGKSSLACDLYLKNRSALIKQAVKELRLAEDPLSYLRRLSMIVHGNLGDVAREFSRLFSGNTGCYSVLMLWSSGELKTFVNLVVRHVIDPGPSLSVIGHSVRLIYANCEELADLGLDLVFELDTLLTPHVEKVVQEHGKNLLDATKLRISEDRWKPYNLQSETALNKFLEEMREIGLVLDSFLCEDSFSTIGGGPEKCRLWLTAQSCHFARNVIPMSRDLAHLRLAQLKEECDSLLMAMWRTQLDHLRQGLSGRGRPPQQKQVAEHCARLTIGQVMPLCETSFVAGSQADKSWTPLQDLLARDFPALAPFRAQENQTQYEMIGDV